LLTAIEFFDRAYGAHRNYWRHSNRDSIEPRDFSEPWRSLLLRLRERPPGRALDLGAGEGMDAIRLARLGYEVDAVEGSGVGAAKIVESGRAAGVRVNVVHADARVWRAAAEYDVIICSGLLHYLEPEHQGPVLARLRAATRTNGLNLITTFSDHSPVPTCHRVVDVFPDREDGTLTGAYRDWEGEPMFVREKREVAHVDFPPHAHSFIKLLATKLDDTRQQSPRTPA
jgi:SAM-dependent methyltransferase